MTIDIKIGKLKVRPYEEVIKEQINENYTVSYETPLPITFYFEVEQCPDELDGCTEEDTLYPNSAYRSGSIMGMHNWFETVLPELIKKMRSKSTNDSQFTLIKPFLSEINELKYDGEDKQHSQRLKWFKFWCNRAVELYDKDAGIRWS